MSILVAGEVLASETTEEKIARAISAAAAAVKAQAAIMDSDGTVLREGSNGWTWGPVPASTTSRPRPSDIGSPSDRTPAVRP